MSEWISVKDRLPEDDETILCCLEKAEDRLPVFAYYDKEKNLFWPLFSWQAVYICPTHWMSLPETPNS